MATDTLPQSKYPDAASHSATKTASFGATDMARAIIAPLASLKLTVFLLVIAILVIFIGTLEQTRNDIDTVKHRYFLENRVFVQVPLETFFVPAWFPNFQNVSGSIWIPSGMTLLVAMMINLTAAHLLRFRLQASGLKLMIGLVVAAVAAMVTWAIIFNAQNPNGLQGAPPIPWSQMWIVLQIVVLGIACAAGFAFFSLERHRVVEKVLMALAAIVFGGLLIVTLVLKSEAFIGDSAMRIVWQLTQSSIAASISLVACMLLFKRKAGIVLLHLGIVGLMANELYVNATNQEQQMTIFEGETVNEAVDIRTTELAILDTSDPEFDEIIGIPESKLKSGETIDDPQLPFKVKGIAFYHNSKLGDVTGSEDNLATRGIGLRRRAVELPISVGTDTDSKVDPAAGYIELFEKQSGNSLGTFLVSQLLDTMRADPITIEGKTYRFGLQHKTEYKSVSMTLQDVKADFYPGTKTPRNYSSQVVLNDTKNGAIFEHNIWMNNPLRFGGETFYQNTYGQLPSGKEYTVLQLVKNRGWMIPYVCCMFTVIGLAVQFGSSLLGYLEKKQSPTGTRTKSQLAADLIELEKPTVANQRPWLAWLPTFLIVGFFALYVGGQWYRAQTNIVEHESLRLDLLGQLPITQNGRTQPLDSFARHTALQLSKRETVKNRNEKSQPAIRWLADLMFQADGYDEYRLFRIEDPEVLSALDLPYPMPTEARYVNSNLRYTLQEVMAARSKFATILPDPEVVDPKTWTLFQQRVGDVASKLQKVLGAQLTLGQPDSLDGDLIMFLERAGMEIRSPSIPLAVVTDDAEKPYTSYVALQYRSWLAEQAKKYDAHTTDDLATLFIDRDELPKLRNNIVKLRAVDRLIGMPEMLEILKTKFGESDPEKLAQLFLKSWDSMPAEIRDGIEAEEGPLVDAMIGQRRPDFIAKMAQQVALINGGAGPISDDNSELFALLSKLRPAYNNNDAETFNRSLADYLAAVKTNPPAETSTLGLATEGWYNSFAPFYLAMVMYIAAMLVGIVAWIGWPVAWNRAACGLLVLGLLIHVIGLVARVMISGRPPVTNLYSSFLFVSAVFVFGMLVLERMSKLGVGYVLAAVGGFLALMAAWNLSLTDGDTFAVLVAVLDTQFWLATHVVCISIGYGATLMAGFLGLAFVVRGWLAKNFDKRGRRDFSNVIYGVICFGLVTSFFGTVLGGLWADDSWGRFWGWDPKENGAMMIVLWNAVALHARWGGMIRERGMAALSIIGTLIVLWSWKGVNAMGVGLHAYAGTEDKTLFYILLFGALNCLILTAGMIPTRYWRSYASD